MAKPRIEANWVELNLATLTPHIARAYEAYKEAYRTAKVAKEKFEDDLRLEADLPEGKKLVFGYNFGKLSVAIVDDEGKPKAASKSAQSLSSFLQSQMNSGKRC